MRDLFQFLVVSPLFKILFVLQKKLNKNTTGFLLVKNNYNNKIVFINIKDILNLQENSILH